MERDEDAADLDPGEVREGDLIFFTGGADDLSRMLGEVDGVILTQVGIALGDGTVVSCRTDGDGPLDLAADGGVRRDAVSRWRDEWGREAIVGRVGPGDDAQDPATADRRGRIAARARDHLRHPTRFSATKTVLWVLALGTMPLFPFFTAEDGERMVDLADRAGDAWRAGAESPVFSGPEFVAGTVGARFTRAHLQHNTVIFLDRDYRSPRPRYDDLLAAVHAEQRRHPATDLLYRLAAEVAHHHPEFMPEIAAPLAARAHDRDTRPATVLPRAVHRPVPGAERPVPTALTTPRMLAEAPWIDDLVLLGR